jgi:hypothetical protein
MKKEKKKMPEKKVYHCDGYYFDGVCEFRGGEDAADIRDDWKLPPRHFCTNFGLDKKGHLCRHCVENKGSYREEPRELTGRIISLTPYHAKNSETKTMKAFSKPKDLAEYLKGHPELYGIDVRSGDKIGVEVV